MNPLNKNKLVSVDIETTGLDPKNNRITEIAALRLENGEITEKFVTFVNPKIPIPLAISRLTGITDEMVAGAPSEKEAITAFYEFVGDSEILGQSIDFDVNFIATQAKANGLKVKSFRTIDTIPIAILLYPRALRYNLTSLAGLFKIEHNNAHRAESDAQVTAEVASKLWQKLLSLDDRTAEILSGLVQSSGDPKLSMWFSSAKPLFRGGKTTPPEIDTALIANFDNITGNPSDPAQCQMSENDIVKFLGPDSPMKSYLDGFVVRDMQIEMAQAVLDSLEYDIFLLAEAGTGTGKSFAYLLPSIAFSAKKGQKVIISTRTKNLQEQLYFKDIPSLRKGLTFDFRSILLKGRGNYLCLNRFNRVLSDYTSLGYEDRAVVSRLLVWSAETTSGDIAEVSSFYLKKHAALWSRLKSEAISCIGKRCPFRGKCFLNRIRSAVVDAQIVVVNHSLLLAEIGDTSVIGEYDHAIIDEAHDIEEVAAEYFGAKVNSWNFTTSLDELYQDRLSSKGLLSSIAEFAEKHKDLPDDFANCYQACISKVITLRRESDNFFTTLTNQLNLKYKWRKAPYSLKIRFSPGEDVFESLRFDIIQLAKHTKSLVDNLSLFLVALNDIEDDNLDALHHEALGQIARLAEAADALEYSSEPTDPDSVYWWESPQKQDSIDCAVCWAPLDVAERMFEVFHSQKKSLVFTSATMSVADSFDFVKGRLGLNLLDPERVATLKLGSPYDFSAQLLAIFPDFIPEPNARDYIPKLSMLIEQISKETRAGSLALFTSYSFLRQVYSIITPSLEDEGLLVMAQGISGGRSQLTRQFISDKESVLLGTQSFWQGVDVRGDALQILYLTKLPFAVPTDPYVAGQCERIQRHGGDPFSCFTIPQAVIKFRQGAGRLIRGEEDVGVLLICDKRLLTKSYGTVFLSSLPVEVERAASLGELLLKIKRFL
ncbi:hypothetical protein KAH81_06630 [bacterium]|nr:hypothetical protein [bacterium]